MNQSSPSLDSQQAIELARSAVTEKQLSESALTNLQPWLTEPQYAPYQPALLQLIEARDFGTLDTYFWEVIPFGTGGRRGLMSDFGSATINERTIAESAHGLAAYYKKASGNETGKAAIAHDSRINSNRFARIAASVIAAHGLTVYFYKTSRSTPELSFAVRQLGCDVGAMITASHNPPSDNGFKAYWSTGGQVLPPHDQGIIDEVYQATEIPMLDFDQAVAQGLIKYIDEDLAGEYRSSVITQSHSTNRDLSGLFSPLHGVGETSVFQVLQQVGFTGVKRFEPQCEQNGNFPNVPDQLPNPERTEVYQPAIELAKETGAEIILASDPDADRLGVCTRNEAGEFIHLTGNQVGALLADYVLRKRQEAGTLTPDHYVVETIVTTPLIGAISRAANVRIINNLLVGFKYIAETMDEEGPAKFVFGTEESLGYLAGEYCRDKDAAVAALWICELAAELKSEGKTLLNRLDELYLAYGYHLEGQVSKTCKGSSGNEQIKQLMKAFRQTPPQKMGNLTFTLVRDYQNLEIRSLPENTPSETFSKPQGNVLMFEAKGAGSPLTVQLGVRPSGTEPKIKFYYFAQAAVTDPTQLEETKSGALSTIEDFKQALMDWIDQTLETS
ncbi:phospho-sugar mutase [uncultured Gimesia sp.]|uniref:phospho-sugar mutase n=1 Tax=uncultured Gimesia sp. TaxID=1678688 RepID=UPI0030D86298|tara:strand:+ start:64101 stop:65948 length:1848 start_codon:yes stop_codon:yes gene_type:complete